MLEKFKKLKNKNFAELKERGRQGANIPAERLGVSAQVKLPTDKRFFEKFDLGKAEKISSENFYNYLRARKNINFYCAEKGRLARLNRFDKKR